MAAAIIPLVTTAVGAVAPLIPGVIQQVEKLFGHSSDTGKQDGPAKMQTAVDMLTAALRSLANAGKIPSAPVVDPSLPAGLAGAIQSVFDQLTKSGALAPSNPVAPVTSPIAGASWKIVGTLTQG